MHSLYYQRRIAVFFVLGLVVATFMVARSQIAGDQLNLLAFGWLFAFEGEWLPYGNPTTAGGVTPGGATALLVGLPLLLWKHHRAATLIVFVSHIVAYWLLDRLLRRIVGAEERFLFAVLYWLNPWRIYHSAFLWNPNYLFFFGAVHLWTTFQLRQRALFWPSFFHVLSLGIALQIEIVALPLAVSTLLFWWKGYLRMHRAAAMVAALLVVASLVPWAILVLRQPSLMAREDGFIGFGLMFLYPLYRGVHYWVRYASLALSSEIFCLDFSHLIGTAAMTRMSPYLAAIKGTIYVLTLPPAIWSNYRLWRGSGRWWQESLRGVSDGEWLVGVVRWSFVAAVIVFALAPSNIMRWHVLAEFHVAVLPPVLAFGDALRRRRSSGLSRGIWIYAVISIALVLVVAVAAPVYRCGGNRCGLMAVTPPALRFDHPMLDDLSIRASCPVEIDAVDGFWPIALPEPVASAPAP